MKRPAGGQMTEYALSVAGIADVAAEEAAAKDI